MRIGRPDVLCGLCGMPARSVQMAGIRFVGCPCVGSSVWAVPVPTVLLATNHDPGDEDRSER